MTPSEIKLLQERLMLLPLDQRAIAMALASKMSSLGIGATFVKHIDGPVVESYFFRLSASVPLAKVLSKSEDMAFATNRESAVIMREGNLIAIQLAKTERKKVDFNECLFQTAPELFKLKAPILLGKTSVGANAWLDLAEEPHALIAGSTGSGKSMFLLSTICTLAVIKKPEELRLFIIDSKQIDLTLCEALSHVQRVARNALEFHEVLDYLHNEMRRRNSLLSGIARNIDEYNTIQQNTGSYSKLSRIILIIDEFADVLEEDYSQAKAKIEPFTSFTRLGERLRSLAQLSRASGIHIIAATQRPSVKITSGDLKVNLPCRISFKLSSVHDSKTVLKEVGAESLLGKGDMLVQSVSNSLLRVHAPYVEMGTLGAILADVEGVRNTLQNVITAQEQGVHAHALGEG